MIEVLLWLSRLWLVLLSSVILLLTFTIMLYARHEHHSKLSTKSTSTSPIKPSARRCNTAQQSPIRRKTIAILLRKTNIASPVGAQAPLAIPKLWRSYSGASYIPSTLRGEGLGESGGALLMKEGRGGWGKTSHDGKSKTSSPRRAVGERITPSSEEFFKDFFTKVKPSQVGE